LHLGSVVKWLEQGWQRLAVVLLALLLTLALKHTLPEKPWLVEHLLPQHRLAG
jgi:hypothetical protein